MDAPAATPPLAEKKKRNRRRSGRGAGGSRILLFLDIASKIMLLSQQCPGAISCYQRMALYPLLPFVSLHLQASLTMQLTRVIFQIVSLSGSYLLADEGEPTGGLNIALSTPCGGIFGGSIGGPLIAAHLVQVVAGSFTCSMKVPKRNEAKSNDDQHTELKVPIWKMQAIRVML